jgi:hypothetical protein
MFQNPIIDIAIGLILMYLVLSLVCTVVNEFIATKLELRSRSLEAGLKQMLDDKTLQDAFYGHGLISGYAGAIGNSQQVLRGGNVVNAATVDASGGQADNPSKHPSYLSGESFALALIGSLATGKTVPGLADIQDAIEKLPANSRVRQALLASLIAARDDFDRFRQSVATWFDDTMEGLSGAYKRHLKVISLVVGCTVAVIANADTFAVGSALWSSQILRAQIVQVARETVDKGAPSTPGAATPTDIANAFKQADQTLTPLPLGWPTLVVNVRTLEGWGPWAWFVLSTLLGWFVTGLALSLGAPFWFDLLSKFVNIRGAGSKPQRADEKQTHT